MYRQPTNKHRVLAMKDKFENKNCSYNVQNMSVTLSETKCNNIPQRVFLNNNNATTECTNSNIVPYIPKQITGSPKRIIKRSEAFRRDKNSADSISSFQRNLVLRTSCRTNNIDDKIKLFDNSNTNQPLQRSGSFSDLYSTPQRKGNFSKDIESKLTSARSKNDLKIDNQCDNPIHNTAKESTEIDGISRENVNKLTSFKNAVVNTHLESHLNGKSLQETFKEALKRPLPAGPAPSKPPRTFLYSPNIKTANKIPKEEKPPILSKESLIKKEPSKFIKSDPKYMLDKLETALRNNRAKFKRQERIGIRFTAEDNIEAESTQKTCSKLKEPVCNINLAFEDKSEEVGTLLSAVGTFKSEKSRREKNWEPIYDEPFHHNKMKNERSNTNRNSLYYMSSPVVLVNRDQSFDFKD